MCHRNFVGKVQPYPAHEVSPLATWHACAATLRSWSSADLPKDVSVRVWVDEETGKLRALHRRADGTVTSAETAITTTTSLEEQVKRFVARLARSP
jgi:hypothetical protein